MIRAVRPTDVAALRSFLKRDGAGELTTHTWPKVQPESGHLPLAEVLSQSLGRRGCRRGLWLAESEGRLTGYVLVRARCDGMLWDVEHLHAARPEAAVELLEQACSAAAAGGGRRVFLDVPAGSGAAELARRAGFQRYATATLLRRSPPFTVDSRGAVAARPRLRADEQPLFQLYSAAVPAPVRAAEAMSYEEWSALYRGSKKWRPTLLGDRHQFVWDLGAGLIGWMEVVYGQKSQYIEMLVHPQYEPMLDGLVAYALTQVSPKAAVYALVRAYQPSLASALGRAGFEPVAESDLLVRQLAARVPEPHWVPAKVVGG